MANGASLGVMIGGALGGLLVVSLAAWFGFNYWKSGKFCVACFKNQVVSKQGHIYSQGFLLRIYLGSLSVNVKIKHT
jgi:hypothetical protein